jgi:manganese efflux pump family protein
VLALLLLAAALGLDNLAAALGIGVGGVRGATRVRVAVVFGLFEAGMPVLGLVLGHRLADSLGLAARWLGGAVLIAFGVYGLIHAWREAGRKKGTPSDLSEQEWPGRIGSEQQRPGRIGSEQQRPWRIGRMVIGGLVLSGDNLAAGFALGSYHTNLVVAATVFGVVSVAMSLVGLELGARIGAAAGDRSELIASALLIVVGVVIATGAL